MRIIQVTGFFFFCIFSVTKIHNNNITNRQKTGNFYKFEKKMYRTEKFRLKNSTLTGNRVGTVGTVRTVVGVGTVGGVVRQVR